MVEVVIAVAILALSVLSILAMIDMAVRTAMRSDLIMQKSHLARTIIEDLKAQGYYSSALALGSNSLSGGVGYYRVVASTNYAGAKDIHLTLRWTEPGRDAIAGRITLSTTITEALVE